MSDRKSASEEAREWVKCIKAGRWPVLEVREQLASLLETLAADNERKTKALERAEVKLSAYVGVCRGDKELTDTVLPMVRAALRPKEDATAAPCRNKESLSCHRLWPSSHHKWCKPCLTRKEDR